MTTIQGGSPTNESLSGEILQILVEVGQGCTRSERQVFKLCKETGNLTQRVWKTVTENSSGPLSKPLTGVKTNQTDPIFLAQLFLFQLTKTAKLSSSLCPGIKDPSKTPMMVASGLTVLSKRALTSAQLVRHDVPIKNATILEA